MVDRLHDLVRPAEHALGLLVDNAASVNVVLLAAGTALYILNQCVRTIGWHTILRASYPEANDLRRRHLIRPELACPRVLAVAPARACDVNTPPIVDRHYPGPLRT